MWVKLSELEAMKEAVSDRLKVDLEPVLKQPLPKDMALLLTGFDRATDDEPQSRGQPP